MTECGMKRYWTFFLCCLAGLCPSSAQTAEETQQVKGIVGESVTFSAQVLNSGSLSYNSLGNIAMVVKGNSDTELTKEFRGRLQWNSQTGVFIITYLRAEDSGKYKVENTFDGQKNLTAFQLEVYERVSTPTVTLTAVGRLNCSVLCSVENGREVTLSWQREGETLSNTSSPDLNTNLSLPLEIRGPKHTYYCEVKNPASSQRHMLDIPENCTESSGETQEPGRHRSYIIPIAAAFSLIGVLVVIGLFVYLKRGRRHYTEDTGSSDVQYAVINHSNQTETQHRDLPELDTSAQNSKLTTVYDELRPREETPPAAGQC